MSKRIVGGFTAVAAAGAAAVAAAGVAVVTSLGLTAPAFAAGGTDTTFTVTGGTLSISVPASANLGTVSSGSLAPLVSQLGAVTVTDNRAVNLGAYTTKVQGTPFTTGSSYSVPAANVLYVTGAVTGAGTAVRAPGAGGSLDQERTAATATGVVGSNTSVWNPTVTVNLPSDAVAGSYSGTITHSVA